jgi:hypothetical protein
MDEGWHLLVVTSKAPKHKAYHTRFDETVVLEVTNE